MKRSCLLVVMCVVLTSCAVQNRAVPTQANCNYQSVQGDEFVFARTAPGNEADAYMRWRSEPNILGKPLQYDKYVGRKGKMAGKLVVGGVPGVMFWEAILDNCESVLAMEQNSLKNIYPDLVYRGGARIPRGIYLVKDAERAKDLIGKIIWLNRTKHSPYVEPSVAEFRGIEQKIVPRRLMTPDRSISYPIHHLEPLMVTDVVFDRYDTVSVSTSFYLKVKNTFADEGLLEFDDHYFSESDPVPFGTPSEIREVMERESVKLGMTKEQVTLSWGKPKKINKSVGPLGVQEQWIYDGNYVYFEGETLKSFQSSE